MSHDEIPEHEAAFQRRAAERAATAAEAHHQRQVEAERARLAYERENAARAAAKEAARTAAAVHAHDTEPPPATSRSPHAIALSPSDDPTTATTIAAEDPGMLRCRGRRRP